MSALKRRAQALEDHFAYEQEFMFKAQARTHKLIGLWASAIMGRGNDQDYANELATAAVTDPASFFARVRRDFDAAGVALLDDEIQSRMVSTLKQVADDMYQGR